MSADVERGTARDAARARSRRGGTRGRRRPRAPRGAGHPPRRTSAGRRIGRLAGNVRLGGVADPRRRRRGRGRRISPPASRASCSRLGTPSSAPDVRRASDVRPARRRRCSRPVGAEPASVATIARDAARPDRASGRGRSTGLPAERARRRIRRPAPDHRGLLASRHASSAAGGALAAEVVDLTRSLGRRTSMSRSTIRRAVAERRRHLRGARRCAPRCPSTTCRQRIDPMPLARLQPVLRERDADRTTAPTGDPTGWYGAVCEEASVPVSTVSTTRPTSASATSKRSRASRSQRSSSCTDSARRRRAGQRGLGLPRRHRRGRAPSHPDAQGCTGSSDLDAPLDWVCPLWASAGRDDRVVRAPARRAVAACAQGLVDGDHGRRSPSGRAICDSLHTVHPTTRTAASEARRVGVAGALETSDLAGELRRAPSQSDGACPRAAPPPAAERLRTVDASHLLTPSPAS